PHWTAFEKVHISLIPTEVLTEQRAARSGRGSSGTPGMLPGIGQPALKPDTASTNLTESVNDLRLQIRELTDANLKLQSQLKEQSAIIEKLKGEFEGLRNEKKPGTLMPSSGSQPSRKQTTP